jgi:hypothetical protein
MKISSEGSWESMGKEDPITLVSAVIRIQESCVSEFSRVLYLEIIVDTTAKLLGRSLEGKSYDARRHMVLMSRVKGKCYLSKGLGIEGGAEFLA